MNENKRRANSPLKEEGKEKKKSHTGSKEKLIAVSDIIITYQDEESETDQDYSMNDEEESDHKNSQEPHTHIHLIKM